jgi:hypothetical protein
VLWEVPGKVPQGVKLHLFFPFVVHTGGGGAEYTYIHVDTNCYSGKAKVLLYEGEVRTTDSPPARIPMEGLNPIHGRYAHEQHRQSPRDGTSNHTHGEENKVKGKSIRIVDIYVVG